MTVNGVMALILPCLSKLGSFRGAYVKMIEDVVKKVHVHYLISC